MSKVSALHLVPPDEAVRLFDEVLRSGTAWRSLLMQYRTTSKFQEDWKIEVGNWIARARQLGFLDRWLKKFQRQREVDGSREADDVVHRNVTHWLNEAMVVHYFVGTGWGFHAWDPPDVSENRRSGKEKADVDVQLVGLGNMIVDLQVKASGTLGRHPSDASGTPGRHANDVDADIQTGVKKAAGQLPFPNVRPALIVVAAQRDWPLTADIDVVDAFIGNTVENSDGSVLLRDRDKGMMATWPHVSGIVVLDFTRFADVNYECVVLQNPWAQCRLDPAWFPDARVLSHDSGRFSWVRGTPDSTTFPDGTRCV